MSGRSCFICTYDKLDKSEDPCKKCAGTYSEFQLKRLSPSENVKSYSYNTMSCWTKDRLIRHIQNLTEIINNSVVDKEI